MLCDGHHGLQPAVCGTAISRPKRRQAASSDDIDWTKVTNRTIYIGPEAYSLYSTSYSVIAGYDADRVNEEDVPISINLQYNLIK